MSDRRPLKFSHGAFTPPVITRHNEIDLKTNRNAKMIQILLRPQVNGLFLYYLEGTGASVETACVMPPGLAKEEIAEFQFLFQNLFEKFAAKAMKHKR